MISFLPLNSSPLGCPTRVTDAVRCWSDTTSNYYEGIAGNYFNYSTRPTPKEEMEDWTFNEGYAFSFLNPFNLLELVFRLLCLMDFLSIIGMFVAVAVAGNDGVPKGMRAADSKGPPPPPSPPHFSQLQINESAADNPQHAYMKRYQESPMRVESSTMSDPSCGLHRAALGEECLNDECEDEEQMKDRIGRREEEERMTQSPDTLIGSINLHMELATKKREDRDEKDKSQKLAEKLLRQQDYSDLKRELRLLKALDMGGWQSWGTEQMESASPTNDKTPSEPPDTNGARMTPPSEDESAGGPEEPSSASTPPSASSVDPIDSASTEQLQRYLRINVDRFCGESLNTLTIARCVRELLSVNNIGQRLFAKLVLGLSQGTVSELLSKPKPWDKLTEKGRDSYRKMHAWACDQHCVMLLKSMLPKKGREGSSKPETEDRNAPPNPETTCPTSSGIEDNNNNTPEVSIASHPHTAHKDLRHHMHHMGHHPIPYLSGGIAKTYRKKNEEGQPEEQVKQAQDEIRQALAIYHRELTLLAAQGSHHPDPSCHACPMHRRQDCGIPFCRDQPACCLPHPQQQNPHDHGGFFPSDAMKVLSPYSGASPLIPLPPEGQQTSNSEESSPLQRMQSITNSLLNQAATPSFNTLPQRPMKAVLPPITQQQFDHYNNLNTEEIVKRVKEQLSQYSISQRLFGESVLGLSQGSVSDLLARPKPWHMLTQKGREPFIRMKMFLEDENAVHKLVASQYKIAPERLMRMGGYGGVPVPPGPNRFSPVSSSEPTYPSHQQTPSKPSHPSSPQPPSTPESPSAPLTAHSPSGSAALPSSANLKGAGPPGRRGNRCLAPYVQPSVYEMAAVTTDLDTQIITARIKETLTVHNIGQKLFGEAVLGLSQGSVSELLSKPKPWHMLSIKGREPFIRMQLWLNDPSNVEKLQAIKTERREANKRRRNALDADGPSPLLPCGDQQQQFPLDPIFLYPSSAKKPRILFSEEQKEAMKLAYNLDPYPSTAVMEFLSSELGLSVRTITNWFHNHRMRLKQQNQEPDPPPYPPPENATSFDPIRFRLLLGQRLAEMCKNQQGSANQMLPYFSEAQRAMCPLPGLAGVPLPVSKPDVDNTLDLSVSSHQYPQKEDKPDKEEDSDRRSTESAPTRASSSSSSQLTHAAAIDLTPSADKPNAAFNSRMSPLGFPRVPSTKASLDLSFSTFQKLSGHDVPSSTAPHNLSLDLALRNTTPDIEAILRGASTRMDLHSRGSAMDSPVDLREEKRPNISASSTSGSSNRRKAAAPQWVDPGLDLSPDSDLVGFEDDDDDEDTNEILDASSAGTSQVINGVCVRQTDFSARSVGIDSVMRVDSNEMSFCNANKKEDENAKLEREQNIRRLERAITEHDEGWDDISDDDEICPKS
ncbi:Homeobox protein cut like protein [Argiope bruennichi]|uniref:Homeobox protein cut-like n=1 Tax=Argiope bruennichi TaxID=94029 RepID=A0A8T0ETR4_ARGBR|nr:Homeobox protein cut like protein [Argiope bruennichi]